MRSRKSKDKFFLYIVISLVIHLMVLFFFPFGNIRGIADGKGDNTKDFGYIQYVEFKSPTTTEKKPETPENKRSEKQHKNTEKNNKKKEQQQEKSNVVDKKNTVKEKQTTPETQQENETSTKNKDEKIKENKSSETETEKNNEVMTSKDSDREIEIEEKKKESKVKPKAKSKTGEKSEGKSQTKTKAEPAPQPPPKAGELIGLSPEPQYPKYLVGESRSGTVELKVHINQTGKLETLNIIKSSKIDSMDRNARLTIKRGWKFKPYKKSYSLKIKIHYSMDKEGNPKVDIKLGQPVFK